MNDKESLDAITRMRAAFPAWAVYVTNRSPDYQRTFVEYGRMLKPLPADCVEEGITEALRQQPQPAYGQLINVVAQKAELARSRQRQPTESSCGKGPGHSGNSGSGGRMNGYRPGAAGRP